MSIISSVHSLRFIHSLIIPSSFFFSSDDNDTVPFRPSSSSSSFGAAMAATHSTSWPVPTQSTASGGGSWKSSWFSVPVGVQEAVNGLNRNELGGRRTLNRREEEGGGGNWNGKLLM